MKRNQNVVLIALSILGALGVMVIVGVWILILRTATFENEVNSTTTRAQMTMIRTAIKIFEIGTDSKPESLQMLLDEPSDSTLKAISGGPPLEELPTDGWGNPFAYRITKDGYELRSRGADGQLNTGDDIVETMGEFEHRK